MLERGQRVLGAALLLTTRAPGRAALLGEHCDWAGGASLAVPLPVGVEVRAGPSDGGLSLETELDGAPLRGRWPAGGEVDPRGGPLRFAPAAAAVLADAGIGPTDTHLAVSATVPPGRGFSSSAAFSIAVLDALARRAGSALGPTELAELAYEVERGRLGIACGRLDQLACALGRGDGGAPAAVLLRWEGGQATSVQRVEPGGRLPLVVGAFSAPRDTPGILAALNRHHAGDSPDAQAVAGVRRALARFGALAITGASAVAAGDRAALGAAMDDAQATYERDLAARLAALHAPALIATCRGLRARGALGAKFSGAGGDGSVVALFDTAEAAEAGRRWLGEQGLAAWTAPLG